MSLASFFAGPTEVDGLHDDLKRMVLDRHNATPRHMQKELGPSEIGHLCARHVASGYADLPRCNPPYDPLPSIVGTAFHTWAETAATLANTILGYDRWLTETRVYPAPDLGGSADLYDTKTESVIDWKAPGVNQFQKLKKTMSPTYRVQAHLYGRGFQNAGRDVRNVAVMLVPRGGTLASSVLWVEPYEERVAVAALDRFSRIKEMVATLDIAGDHPERIEYFEKTAFMCTFCPWFSPRPEGPTECPGVNSGIHP